MATTTKLVASNGFYGNSGNGSFTNSAATHMYVGKYGTPTFRSRMTFPALGSAADLGAARIVITRAVLHIRQNDGGPANVTAGCSASSAWNAALDASGPANIASESIGWRTIDVTACANAIIGYSGNWYIHLRSADYIRFSGTGSDWKPYLMVTWEYVAATIRGDKDSVTLGNQVNYTITPEVSGETHTLTYHIGDTEGTIAAKTGNNIAWTPPVSLATEITDDDTGMVEIRLTAYDAAGNVQRTERYYQTVNVPESVKPAISSVGAVTVNGLGGYGLTGRSYLSIAPVIDMNGAQGASIASVAASINGQTIAWTSIAETGAGIFTGAAADTSIFQTAGVFTLTLTVTDSRGRTVTSTQNFTICAYALPVVSAFSVERYEPVYDANEQVSGYQAGDLGDHVWVNLSASVTAVNPAGTQLNSLKWSITAVNANTGAMQTISGTGAQSVNILQDRTKFAAAMGESETWNYTLTVTDSAGQSAVQYSAVLPARASLAVKPGGVGVGCIPGGTEENPLFEVAYPVQFDQVLRGYGGILGSDGYRLDRAVKTQALTLSSSFSAYGEYHGDSTQTFTPTVTRVGPIVFLDGLAANKSSMTLNATEVTVATLPTWARPKTDVFALHQGSGSCFFWMRVAISGAVTFSRYRDVSSGSGSYGSFSAGRQFPMTACWIAADAFE